MWAHQLARALALLVAVTSAIAIIGRSRLRVDVTSERLHTLTGETRRLLSEIPEDRPVFVQAYVSPTVPEEWVQTRTNVLGILREIDAIAGPRVEVVVEETEPYSDAAREAREKFGITARPIPSLASARAGFSDVFLGLAFTSGAEEQVIPFFDRGLPAEYEIVRSIRVVARTERKRIGVVNSELKVFGGLDFQTLRSTPAWSVVEELKKQYEVVQINAAAAITEKIDGLLVVLPSSLSQSEMDNVKDFITAGHPALLLVDPLPIVNIGLSPSEPPGANMNPFMRQGQPPPTPKGNVRQLLSDLGVRWDPARVIWDTYNPHPDLAHLPPEVVFLGKGNQNPETFAPGHPASASLQELVLLYPGEIDKAEGSSYEFAPLLRTGAASGSFSYFQLVQRSFFGTQLNRNLPHRPGDKTYIVAAQVRSPQVAATPAASSSSESDGDDAEKKEDAGDAQKASVNVIVVADVDFISEQFFEIRKIGPGTLNFDNVSFFLNAMDALVGDESFVTLRNRRVKHRTLARVEEQTRSYIQQRTKEEEEAEEEAKKALEEAQKRLNAKVQEIRDRSDLDAQAQQIMARNVQEVENRRFEVLKSNIEAAKEAKIEASKESMESQIRRIQGGIRTLAVLLPPIPVFVLGVMVFLRRQSRERAGAAAARRLRSS